MHKCIYLFTDDLPNDEKIERHLAPYKEHEGPSLRWDWWMVGGRYGGLLKLKIDEDNDDKYKWPFYIDQPRSGKLFRSEFFENLIDLCRNAKGSIQYGFFGFNDIEGRCSNYCGRRDGYFYVDGCKISDLYNPDEVLTHGFGFINAPFAQKATRDMFANDDAYEDALKAAFSLNSDGYVTVLDLHV